MEKHCFLSWDGSPFSLKLCNFFSCLVKKIKSASAGNRTRVYHVGGDNSTTEPPMLEYNHLCSHNFSFTHRSLFSRLWLKEKTRVLCQEESFFLNQFVASVFVLVNMINYASAGNRTRVYRVAGDNSTTEPPMLDMFILCSLWFSV